MTANKTIFLNDYQVPNYLINTSDLSFKLYPEHTRVISSLAMCVNSEADPKRRSSLTLDGVELKLIALSINGKSVPEDCYQQTDEYLQIQLDAIFEEIPSDFILSCETEIYPQSNTSLEGLYRSRTMYCTQCEAEGFRKITYYLDRPDIMSVFTTTIEAPKDQFPVLLSNGNQVDDIDLNNGWRRVSWHDPFKKPAYLFALVAGTLDCVKDSFTTQSGREVDLHIYVETKDLDKCDHAMTALKNSMTWDERVYGREYDLDLFMIVAVDDFNMGAMENKGLNIFNTSCVLAKPETTTDAGFQRVEAVVAHEYFHNWSGNRVTCRDWFQLSLKEGFTVFRDSQFSSDMGSATVKRVEDVNLLRNAQFVEDGGPMAHAVRPESFIEISNFYTLTIYEKGAEIVRMIHTLLGDDLFRKGSDLYFDRHDGQAVTVEHFVAAMADASGRDFSQFMNWYRQAATPELTFSENYQDDAQQYTLTIEQSCRTTAETPTKQPYLMPVVVSLLGEAGALPLKLAGVDNFESADNTELCLELTQTKQHFVFSDVKEKPVASVLRGFSAPVKIQFERQAQDHHRIMTMDSDGFCRWDASQTIAVSVIQQTTKILKQAEPSATLSEPPVVLNQASTEQLKLLLEPLTTSFKAVLNDASLDPAMIALMLEIPSASYLLELSEGEDITLINAARDAVKMQLAGALEPELEAVYESYDHTVAYQAHAGQIASRSLKNLALSYLCLLGQDKYQQWSLQQYKNSKNMTDSLSALRCISQGKSLSIDAANCLADFYQRWSEEALVVNQWFMLQAARQSGDALAEVEALLLHPAYDLNNPNKVRSVVAVFCNQNTLGFHRADGKGYQFLAKQIILLDGVNPQLAARLIAPLSRWRKYDPQRQQLMKSALEFIKLSGDLSKDVSELLDKSLA